MTFARLIRLSIPIRPRVDKRFFFSAFGAAGSGKGAPSLLSSLLSGASPSTAGMDDKGVEAYIHRLGKSSPRDALRAIERGWANGKVPVSDAILHEYLKAAAALNRLDSVDVSGLLALVNKERGRTGGDSSSASPVMVAPMLASTSGSSSQDPLYVARTEPSFRAQLWGVLKTTIGLFLILSFAGSLIDEKGGGIASKIGGGNIVHVSIFGDISVYLVIIE